MGGEQRAPVVALGEGSGTPAKRARRPTETSSFGSARRESHDASAFYERFVPPELSRDDEVTPPAEVDFVACGDSRSMTRIASSSVALVVTSPPYFAGKEYERTLGENGVPASYFDYLELLHEVFAECKRVLEPGGRIAVNVANLGRRPYRSLAGDVTSILTDLGLLLRGEVVWWKGRAAGGSCAWGTFQRPSNPVLRDVTERIVIASKGRFDRALSPEVRRSRGLPSVPTVTREEFLEATTDLWELPTESATRVGHPAPFPVELPGRLIQLFTYEGDLVLDPFMGSGSTAVAAVRADRHFAGYDTDPEYVTIATDRVEEARRQRAATRRQDGLPAPVAAGLAAGLQTRELAALLLESAGFTALSPGAKLPGTGVELTFTARDRLGRLVGVEVAGSLTTGPSGLRRTDLLFRAIAKAAVAQQVAGDQPFLLLTTELPPKGTPSRASLDAVVGPGRPIAAVLELLSAKGVDALSAWASGTAG